jgi:hypothetical protein
MTRRTRRTHAPGFKAKEALAAITKGEQTLAELARVWRSVKYEEVYLHACDSVGQGPQVCEPIVVVRPRADNPMLSNG